LSWNNTYLNISSYIPCTKVEGPGKRFAIWVQGCLKRCKGCCNPNELELIKNNIVPTHLFMEKIFEAQRENNIEGITLLGGEPILQAKGLSYIAEHSQKNGLSVMLFTGYTQNELDEYNFPFYNKLKYFCDIIVDGPYDQTKPDNLRNWIGSTNQDIHFLTNRYNPGIEYDNKYRDSMEFRIYPNELTITGYPFEFITKSTQSR
jgi:anaerobic ribonucleoside-triphosphate reductase activating protein